MQKIVSWWAGIFRRMQRQSRAVILVFADVLSISASYFAALMLRFDFIEGVKISVSMGKNLL